MARERLYRGWNVFGRLHLSAKRLLFDQARAFETDSLQGKIRTVARALATANLSTAHERRVLATLVANDILERFIPPVVAAPDLPFFDPLASCLFELIENEALFTVPHIETGGLAPPRSALWEAEDALRRTMRVVGNLDASLGVLADVIAAMIEPLIRQCPALVTPTRDRDTRALTFNSQLLRLLGDLPAVVDGLVQLPFVPEVTELGLLDRLGSRLDYNLVLASGGVPGGGKDRPLRLPSKVPAMPEDQLLKTYLAGTPFLPLFATPVPITIPEETRFEHHHIVAGSGHGKTQTLQQLILHDLDAVAAGEVSIVVIDSQSDLINTIANLAVFAPDGPLADRLCLIDPTDVEWPVALNLFDVGLERINQYSQLDRERLINGVLELYDFVLGSLLDAGMTQKQTVIFRYITRLLLHIPGATIHTFRQLLEDGGATEFRPYIDKLEGSARSFFATEYDSREFTQTRKQVLRRLYGVLENQSFERMFSHPKNKVDLFSELNAGKVILINTAKDLLKENGSEIFGRFFIAMLAQAAQERAVLPREKRLPTFVYIDEANDYFDRTIGIILSQARKYRVGVLLAHQFLGQLDTKLHEAIAANTAIKFAGGVSAKDARALAGELRTDPGFIEAQEKLSFAAYVKGTARRAVPITIAPGQMERLPRLSEEQRTALKDAMRAKYAVHYTQARVAADRQSEPEEAEDGPTADDDPRDTGEPMPWE